MMRYLSYLWKSTNTSKSGKQKTLKSMSMMVVNLKKVQLPGAKKISCFPALIIDV